MPTIRSKRACMKLVALWIMLMESSMEFTSSTQGTARKKYADTWQGLQADAGVSLRRVETKETIPRRLLQVIIIMIRPHHSHHHLQEEAKVKAKVVGRLLLL